MTNEVFTMLDGTHYVVRLCADLQVKKLKQEIHDGFKRMSQQSRWMRFASAVGDLSERQLDYLSDLDSSNHVAWCAGTRADAQGQGVGLARYLRLNDEPDVAEFAVTVIDEFQGQGVGVALLQKLLESARNNDIRVLRGYVLPQNEPMLGLCRHMRARVELDGEIYRVELFTAAR